MLTRPAIMTSGGLWVARGNIDLAPHMANMADMAHSREAMKRKQYQRHQHHQRLLGVRNPVTAKEMAYHVAKVGLHLKRVQIPTIVPQHRLHQHHRLMCHLA